MKATVDAYDGKVTLYNFDPNDPILAAWNRAFGGNLIKPASAIPPELAAHFRYPEDLFKVQRDLLAKFHVDDPRQFNSAQDFWSVPDDPAKTASSGGAAAGPQPPVLPADPVPGRDDRAVPADSGAHPAQPAEPGRAADRGHHPGREAEPGAARATSRDPGTGSGPGATDHDQRYRGPK